MLEAIVDFCTRSILELNRLGSSISVDESIDYQIIFEVQVFLITLHGIH